MTINTIHESLVNGQRRQMADQIDEYGLYDFWADYRDFLNEMFLSHSDGFKWMSDAVVSYHRIRSR